MYGGMDGWIYVCMYIYIYVYMDIYICIYIYYILYIYGYVCIYIWIFGYIDIYGYIYIHIWIYGDICGYMSYGCINYRNSYETIENLETLSCELFINYGCERKVLEIDGSVNHQVREISTEHIELVKRSKPSSSYV